MFEKLVDFFTDKKRKVPLIMITFDYQKFVRDGVAGSCIVSAHPDLATDQILIKKLEDVVDYIRSNNDMEKIVKL